MRKALELKGHDLRVKNVSVHLDVSDSLPPISGDPHQLLQVLVNLISNAEQAMYASDRGGRITFEASATQETVSLLMRDTGPGIPEHLREKVFEPFFTTKEEGEGTGLGLSICHEILQQQQASIQLMQASDSGAVFVLAFPIHRASEQERPERPHARRRVRLNGRRIVVVEDDPTCRTLVVDAFEGLSSTVRPFDRSEAALRYLRSHPADAIISDIHRPGLNGMEFYERVRQFDDKLAGRILFLTGDTLSDDLATFLKRTGCLCLAKPVLLNDLFEAVEKLVSGPARGQMTLFPAGGPAPRLEQEQEG
ncbi:MAG: response regulator [Planctomycetes bacterium]|nr:response regulator [Planctomycetota bacterium]